MSAVVSARTDDGIRLEGLAKTFRGPHGPIHAVRGVDVSIAAGETAALLGPNGAGKSTTIDMLLGLAKPDGGTVSVFGRAPRDAVDDGLVGAMLQTGELIRELTVREIIAMMASLYPGSDGRRRGAYAHRAERQRRAENAEALGRGDPACSFRDRAG
jgi:ABC-2 type transport system ATP-binding protein